MWGNDKLWLGPGCPTPSANIPATRQTAVRQSLVHLPSLFMTNFESFYPQREKQDLDNPSNLQEYFCRYIPFFTLVPECWEHPVTSLGRKSVCQALVRITDVLCTSTRSISLEGKEEQHFWKTKLQLKKKKAQEEGKVDLVIASQRARAVRHEIGAVTSHGHREHFALSWCSHLIVASSIFIIIITVSDIFRLSSQTKKWNYFGKLEGERKTGRI